MRPGRKFAFWLLVLFAGILGVIATAFGLLATGAADGGWPAWHALLEDRAPLLAFAALGLFAACWGILKWLFRNHITAAAALAEQTRIVVTANREHRVVASGGPELAELAAAINSLGDEYRAQQRELEARIAESGSRLEEQRNRLDALMSELSQGVLLCNAEGRILLYNKQARALFEGSASGSARHAMVGLGRSVFALIDRDQIAHALDKIRYSLANETESPLTRFLTKTASGALIRVLLAPFLSAERRIAGMVLMLEDVTEAFAQEARRRALLDALATNVRRPAANIRAAAENLVAFPEMEESQRARFAAIIADESHALSGSIDAALREHADALKAGMSLEDMPIGDLIKIGCSRIDNLLDMHVEALPVDESLWIKVDSYALVQVMATLAARLRDEHGIGGVCFRAAPSDGFVHLDLVWQGATLPTQTLAAWESQPMQAGAEKASLTIRDVLEPHGGELWPQGDSGSGTAWLRLLLPQGKAAPLRERAAPQSADSRPEYYDFDLFRNLDTARDLLEQDLANLNYTVFDTETTGLEPSAGDEIISIGAVRIVNRRLLKQEVFEQLVNPRRSVPRRAVRVHGIRSRDLADQPSIDEVLPSFHRFCEDTVLVAHNGAFDMRFLELKEAATGIRFGQPVLDTLLLSAVVHPNLEDHCLEAIAERMGLQIIGRHTALGDALVTGEVFLKLLPLLMERGIVSLRQALEASRETYFSRLQY